MKSPLQSRRPEARTYKVEDLLVMTRNGRLRIPAFQRPFRWQADDVLNLFDSIARGFPIGMLLLRQAPASATTLRFGSVKVQAPAMSDALWVVDGQQRLTTLIATLLHPEPEPRGDQHSVWYDLADERFVILRRPPTPTMIPLRVLGDMTGFMDWLELWPLRKERPELALRAKTLFKTLNEHVIPATLVEDADEDELRTLFSRINTTGVRLTESDVFQALFSGESEARPISAAATRLSALEFGPFSDEDLLRCLKAVADIAPRVRLESTDAVSLADLSRTEDAIRRSLVFLGTHAGFPAAPLLPYRLPLFLLARFFDRHPTASVRTLELLSRWVWRGAVSGAHSDTSHAAIGRLQRLIDESEDDSVQRLLLTVPSAGELQKEHGYAGRVFNASSAASRLSAAALLLLEPRSPVTGEPFQWSRLGHQPLKRSFRDLGRGGTSRLARHLWWPEGQKLDIKALPDASDEVLESHAMSRDDARRLVALGADAFWLQRLIGLDKAVDAVINLRLGRHDSDRRPIASLSRYADRLTSRAMGTP